MDVWTGQRLDGTAKQTDLKNGDFIHKECLMDVWTGQMSNGRLDGTTGHREHSKVKFFLYHQQIYCLDLI